MSLMPSRIISHLTPACPTTSRSNRASAFTRELSAFAGYVDADGEVAELRNFQIDRVTCHLRALSNGHSWLAIEHEGAVGARGDRRLFASKRDVRGADLQRDIAERIRKRHAR